MAHDTEGSPAHPPHCFVIEPSPESNVPGEVGKVLPLITTYKVLEGEMHNLRLGPSARDRHCLLDELVVELDIGPHRFAAPVETQVTRSGRKPGNLIGR